MKACIFDHEMKAYVFALITYKFKLYMAKSSKDITELVHFSPIRESHFISFHKYK